ncbi:MAG: methyltransferase domain-containing protein [Gammaproteobacteria bacterium]|nr:methyltransferase domain-containing protein [Gammaproteobacteria bacterium]
MNKTMDHIQSYYSPDNLYQKIMDGLALIGKDQSGLTLDDLQPVDEFHIRGDTATRELIKLSGFTSDMHVLDVGCGVGGSTRRLSHDTGCRATGIDLSEHYIDTATKLTELLNMQERVQFKAENALDLSFDDNSFDGVWSIQMNMNIEDKQLWVDELFRVVKPGGRVVLYEVCGGENTPVYFPVPWAQNETMSALVPPESFKEIIQSSGFAIETWTDKTDLARAAFSHMKEPVGEPELPEIGVHLLVGNDILTKAYNLHRNLEECRVSLVESLLLKP